MQSVPFSQWELRVGLVAALAEQGITVPTEVQQRCWPLVQAGRDLLVQSRTGTGKTLAFGLPILQGLPDGPGPVDALVVLPTRELAMQVATALGRLGAKPALLYGGGAYSEQFRDLRAGARIVVGTPGRLCDHLSRGTLDLSTCRTLVLDEADEILDLGFADEVDRLLEALPAGRQSLLFSATLPPDMQALAAKTLRDPETVAVSTGLSVAVEIRHVAYEVHREFRSDALSNVLHVENPELAIIFCHTRAETEELAERLRGDGFRAAALHGDMAQAERTRTLNAFRRRQLRLLVATDVAARGIDVRGVTHVFNLAVPQSAETYIHRVGRTGRAGDSGMAVTFVAPRDALRFRRLLASAKVELQVRPLPQAEDVRRRLRESYHATVCRRLAEGVDPGLRLLAEELLAYLEPADALCALLGGDPAAQAVLGAGLEVPVPKKPRPAAPVARSAADRVASASPAQPGRRQVQVNVGRRDGLSLATLVRLLRKATGMPARAFGAITLFPHNSVVEVRAEEAERVAHLIEGHPFGSGVLKARCLPRPRPRPRGSWPGGLSARRASAGSAHRSPARRGGR